MASLFTYIVAVMGCYAAYIGSYRRFGTVEEDLPAWPLKFGLVGCPETANVRCVISPLPLQKKKQKKKRRSPLHRSGSRKSSCMCCSHGHRRVMSCVSLVISSRVDVTSYLLHAFLFF